MYNANQVVNEIFFIKEIKEGKTNNGKGKPYLTMNICNKECELEAKYWDMDLQRVKCGRGDYVLIQGQTNLFNSWDGWSGYHRMLGSELYSAGGVGI